MANTFEEKLTYGKGNRSAAFNPTTAFPLDARTYFNSYANAEAVAASAEGVGSTNTTYFYGLELVVVDNDIAVKYIIQPPDDNHETGWLKPLGGTDNFTIVEDDNGNLTLYGFEEATAGKYPRVATREVGEGTDKVVEKYIEWVDIEIPAVTGGTYIDVTTNEGGDYVVTHENAPTLTIDDADTEGSRFVSEITRDEQGHITGYKTEIVNIPDVTNDIKLDHASIDRVEIVNKDTHETETVLEIKGFNEVAVVGNIPRVVADEQGNKAIEWVTVKEAVSDIEDANTVTHADGKSIEETYDATKDTYTLSIKDVAAEDTTDGKILAADGNGGVKWVDDKDINTKTGVKAGNDGVEVELQETPDTGDDRTYVVSHKVKPNNKDDDFDVNNVASEETKGNSGTYVTDVIIDEFGHVAGVHKATDLDTKYDLKLGETATDTNGIASQYDPYVNLVEDGTVKAHINISGHGGTKVLGTSGATLEDQELIIMAPELTIKKDETWWDSLTEDQIPDTVNVVSYDYIQAQLVDGEDTNEANKHQLAIEKMVVPTKKYVDRLVTGATDYLGTVGTAEQLAALNPGKGDFVRVSTAFDDYHASDMLICETPKDGENAAIWSVIHGEIDQNTWVANTKDADGYVAKGEGHPLSFWGTDNQGNPGWITDNKLEKPDILLHTTDGAFLTHVGDENNTPLTQSEIDASVIRLAGMQSAMEGVVDYATDIVASEQVLTWSGGGNPDDELGYSNNILVAREQNTGHILVPLTPDKDAAAASKKYVDDAKAAVIDTIGNGKFTVSGTGYLTGTGSMTANQKDDATVTLDLTDDAKALLDNAVQPDDLKNYIPTEELDNLMKLQPEAAEGNYAIFNAQGQVIDGGMFYFEGNSKKSVDDDNGIGSIGFNLREKRTSIEEANGKIIAEMHIDVAEDSGLEVISTMNVNGTSDDSVVTSGGLALSSATKESLEKADSAIQEITTECTNTTHSHTTTCGGLKAIKTGNTVNLEIDESITFILNCGSAADLL